MGSTTILMYAFVTHRSFRRTPSKTMYQQSTIYCSPRERERSLHISKSPIHKFFSTVRDFLKSFVSHLRLVRRMSTTQKNKSKERVPHIRNKTSSLNMGVCVSRRIFRVVSFPVELTELKSHV
ncbi:hypothetical protein PGB90_003703 [Kerria lacca]